MNPRAAVNDLHPFQGCPFGQLGYFSTEIHMPESHGGEVSFTLFSYGRIPQLSDRAERMGFEPMRPCGQTVFKTASL